MSVMQAIRVLTAEVRALRSEFDAFRRQQTHRSLTIMSDLDDIIAGEQDLLARVTANASATDSVLAILQSDNDKLKALQDQLNAAANDPAKIAQVKDLLGQIIATNDADAAKKAAAITASTPAAPTV